MQDFPYNILVLDCGQSISPEGRIEAYLYSANESCIAFCSFDARISCQNKDIMKNSERDSLDGANAHTVKRFQLPFMPFSTSLFWPELPLSAENHVQSFRVPGSGIVNQALLKETAASVC